MRTPSWTAFVSRGTWVDSLWQDCRIAARELWLAIGVARVLRGGVFAVSVFDPRVFLGAAGILLSVVAVAAYLPARRASHTDPAVILRQN